MRLLLAAAYLCSPLVLGGCVVEDRGPRQRDYDHYDHDRDRPRG